MDKLVEYISFSQNVCERLIALSPKAKVAYLGSDLTPKQLSDKGYTGLDYHIGAMRAHEEWFDEAKQLGLEVNVWTVDDEPNMKWLNDRRSSCFGFFGKKSGGEVKKSQDFADNSINFTKFALAKSGCGSTIVWICHNSSVGRAFHS